MSGCGRKWGSEREGNGVGALPRRTAHAGFSWGFSLSSRWGFYRGLRGRFQHNIHHISRCALLRSWSLPIGQRQSRGLFVIAAGPGVISLVLLLFWAWSWNTSGASMLSLARWPSASGCNCSASLFRSLSQFPHATCQWNFTSYSPAWVGQPTGELVVGEIKKKNLHEKTT